MIKILKLKKLHGSFIEKRYLQRIPYLNAIGKGALSVVFVTRRRHYNIFS
jgi:hypothetical protein